jgi:hypothetical protein
MTYTAVLGLEYLLSLHVPHRAVLGGDRVGVADGRRAGARLWSLPHLRH